MLNPASKVNFDFLKCDPCRRRKRGPCSGGEPCRQCIVRGTPECTRNLGKKMLKEAIAKTKALMDAPEPAAKKGRKCATTSANAEKESTTTVTTTTLTCLLHQLSQLAAPPTLRTRRLARKQKWQQKQPNLNLSSSYQRLSRTGITTSAIAVVRPAAYDGTEPCLNCIAGDAECKKKEGRKTFSMRADEFARQKQRFDYVSRNGGHVMVK